MKDQKFKLTEDPIPYLVIKMALPVSIGFFFHTMFNVVDTYFASKINSVAVAAITISFPIFFMIIAISSGTRQGATALIANAEGSNNKALAKKYLIQTVSFSIIAAVVIMLIGLFSAPYLFKLMHATGDYFNFAIQYTSILLYGCLFIILDSTPTSGLNAVGDTKTYSRVFIIGFFVNLILDPLFIYGYGPIPPMGVKGIAYATIAAEFIATVYVFYRIKKMTEFFDNITVWDFFPKIQYQLDLLRQALPASLNMFCVSAGFFVITFFASFFPSPDTSNISIASYGIAIRIEQIILLPAIGLNFACLSLTGQNFGALKYHRIREGYLVCLKYGLILMLCGSFLLYFGGGYFMQIFTEDINVINIGQHYLKIAALFAPIIPIINISIALMQGIKQPNYTVFISSFKEIIGAVIIFWLICFYLNYKLEGLWVGILIVNYLSVIIFLFIVNHKMKSIGLKIFKRRLT
jgi:putative MATE family efflux protein